jgi:hypothetical protein
VTKVAFILSALICGSPAVLLWGGPESLGIVAGIIALALTVTSFALRPVETKFLLSTVRPAVVIAAVPALWILLQVLPLGAFAHPIWTSARSALGHPITGTISVDPGMTAIGLCQYLTLAAAGLLSTAVAVDRRRAEWLLLALMIGGVISGLLVMTHDYLFAALKRPFPRAQAVDCAVMGAVIASAACIRILEQYDAGHSGRGSIPNLARRLALSCIALAICTGAVLLNGNSGMFVATVCGIVVLVCILIIRWFGLGGWGTMALVAPAIGVAIVIAANQPAQPGRSWLLALAETSSSASTAMNERMLEDAPLLGTGAGTFGALAPIYREMDDPSYSSTASTTAAAFAIELGRPLLWLIAAAALVAIVILLRASLQRGRDWFYPAMGASCLIALFISAFVNAGLLVTAPALIGAGAIGLALAQSKSRTVQS